MKALVFIATVSMASSHGRTVRWPGYPRTAASPHGYIEFMATVDALVLGRKTFETVLAFAEWPYGNKLVLEHVATRSYPSGLVQSEYLIAA
jgi:dihydrofolate reductase